MHVLNVYMSFPIGTAAPIFVEEQPFYQKIWFIVIIACVALIVIVIGLVFCFVKGRSASPYIRERPPLKTTPVFTIENSFDNSVSIEKIKYYNYACFGIAVVCF